MNMSSPYPSDKGQAIVDVLGAPARALPGLMTSSPVGVLGAHGLWFPPLVHQELLFHLRSYVLQEGYSQYLTGY